MALIAQHTAPNFATGNYHRILKVEVMCSPREPQPRYHFMVGFYASEQARDQNADPMYVHQVGVPFGEGVEDPRGYLYDLLSKTELFSEMNPEHDIVPKEVVPEPEPVVQTVSYAPQATVPVKNAVT